MDFSKTQFRAARVRFTTIMVIVLFLVVFGAGPLGFLPGLDDVSSQAYAKPVSIEGDICGSSRIGFAEFAVLVSHWLRTDCNTPDWCGGTDYDHSSTVDGFDLKIFARSWLWHKSGNFSVQNTNNYPTRLAIGLDGKFYVSDAQAGAVFVYNAGLDLIGVLKGLESPLGVAVDAEGSIYVGNNRRDNVEIYSCRGAKLATVGGGIIRMPNDLALDREGNLYVVDSLSNTVRVYDPNHSAVRNIGTSGDGQGQLRSPIALTIAYHSDGTGQEVGELYVADMGHSLVQVFDLQGNFLRSFGGVVSQGMGGWKWQGKFVKLQSLAVDSYGRLHAADCFMNNVQILNAQTGTYIDSYGTWGKGPGQLNLPLDIAIDSFGNVAVTNNGNKRVEMIYTIP